MSNISFTRFAHNVFARRFAPCRYFQATHKDTLAPFTANFKATDELANMWSSVVFHSKDDASRLVCADLVEC